MVQFYLKHLEDSVYPVMTEDQFAMKLFPMYRYFVTVWLRSHNPEVRSTFLGCGEGSRGPADHSSPACVARNTERPLGPASFPEPWRDSDLINRVAEPRGAWSLRRPS